MAPVDMQKVPPLLGRQCVLIEDVVFSVGAIIDALFKLKANERHQVLRYA